MAVSLCAADAGQLALSLKAQTDFERVELSAKPALADAETCQQSQAAVLTVTAPEDLAVLHFRKGYCALAGAVATHNRTQFLTASAEFDQARDAWPARAGKKVKNPVVEPLSSGLRALIAITQLEGGSGGETERAKARQELVEAVDRPACSSNLMPVDFCRHLVQTGRDWLGWMALGEGQLDEAARLLAFSDGSGWIEWVQARRSFESGAFRDAATGYGNAILIWKSIWQDPALLRALGPRPDMPVALADLGGAQLLSGDTASAIRTLDGSIKADASNAHAFYLRARARELAGQSDAALADYNMASRTALASAKDLASGEAHLYRGIALYRRRDFPAAEDEFSSALNFEITPSLRADATAWRRLSAVAGGSCGAATSFLDGSMPKVSPFFPKDEALALAGGCGGTARR
jgi:hypothetical protein